MTQLQMKVVETVIVNNGGTITQHGHNVEVGTEVKVPKKKKEKKIGLYPFKVEAAFKGASNACH